MGIPDDPHDYMGYLYDQRLQRLRMEAACDPCWEPPEAYAIDDEVSPPMNNYIRLAMRTNSTVTGENQDVTPDLLHATLGLCDEFFEYDKAPSWRNAMEELGDLCWFIALASRDLQVDPFTHAEAYLDENPDCPTLRDAIMEFVSRVKKAYAYGAKLDVARLFCLLRVMIARVAQIVRHKSNLTLDGLLEANINKLQARYPEKFDAELAMNRDLRREAVALQQVLF